MKLLSRLAAVALLFTLTAAQVSAHASLVRSDPSPNSVLPVAPATITLWFDEELDPQFSTLSLLDRNLARVDANNVVFPDDHKRMSVGVQPGLPPGAYTVSWRALSSADGHITKGVYAIFVGAPSVQPVVLNPDTADVNALPLPFEVAVRWLNLLAALSLCGALTLNALMGDATPAFAEARLRTARHWRIWVVVTLLVLFVGTIAGQLLQAAAASQRSLGEVLAQGIWLHFLTATRFGQAGIARIGLVDVLLVLFAGRREACILCPRSSRGAGHSPRRTGHSKPRAASNPDRFRIRRPWNVRAPDLLYVVLAAFILLTFSLSSNAAAVNDALNIGLIADWLHLLAIGGWTGGLFALALIVGSWGASAPTVEPASQDTTAAAQSPLEALLVVLRRFSNLTVAAVALFGLTGLYALWRQVGSTNALVGTPYGLTLIIKNLTLVPLLLLGLLNTLILRPDLIQKLQVTNRKWKAAHGIQRGLDRIIEIARRNPQAAVLHTVRIEAGLGALVVLAAAALTALPPARIAVPPPLPPPFQMTRQTSDLKVALAVDPYMVGSQNYAVKITDLQGNPAANVTGVSLRFTFLSTNLGTTTTEMERVTDGTFKILGAYLSQVGAWTVEALVRRKDVAVDARVPYRLNVTDPAGARSAELPPISSSLLFAFFDLAAGIGLMIFAQRRNIPEGKWIGAGAVGLGIALFAMTTVLAPPAAAGSLTNPIVPDEGTLAQGSAIYIKNCAVCHGPAGRGNGPLAATLNPRPADFVQHVNFHTDDVLFEWISKGIAGTSMQPWEGTLTETERWQVLDYIQALAERGTATPPSN
jgi:copper transport protein